MTESLSNRRYTLEEYFEIEANSEDKYEFCDGYIFAMGEALAMAGGSANHSLIVMRAGIAIGKRVGDGLCQVYNSDLRVRIGRKTLWAHPDLTVVCGDRELDRESSIGETVLNPRLIVEVLSPSTEKYDRGAKFDRYREIASLQEYVLISQGEARVESFVRQPDGAWIFSPSAGIGETARLASIGIDVPLSEIYAGVEFPPSTGPVSARRA